MNGVEVRPFEDIINEQGGIQHMLKCTDPFFEKFGEIYFSLTNPGVTKGWHVHDGQTNIFSCIKGTLLLVLYDTREESNTKGVFKEITFGDEQRKLIKIPSGVTYAWKNIGEEQAILANCASLPHDPKKSKKISLEEIPYDWN